MYIIKRLLVYFFGNVLIKKKIKNLDFYLHYKLTEHFTFLFQKEIEYESKIQKSILDFINKDDIIFDVGGNIGQYSLLFSSIVKNKGKVITFEPNKDCFKFLNFNINYNNINNVYLYNIGIGDQNTFENFFIDEKTGGRRSSFNKESDLKKSSEKIEIKTLDSIIKEQGEPNFIKIDVEGFEFNILKGLKTNLKNCNFLIEVRKSTKNQVRDYFKNKDYDVYLTDNGLKKINYTSDLPDFCNLLFIKKIT